MTSSPTNAKGARLTEEQKKENHIRSEQKRREAIREGFDRLSTIVPGIEGQGRSEAIVLNSTLSYTHEQILRRRELLEEAKKLGMDTSEWELQPSVEKAARKQLAKKSSGA